MRENSPARSYDPFARGRHPVGVRTIEAFDAARNRSFPCEVWYPAAERHAGEDLSPATQDAFTPPGATAPKRQMAVRDAAAHPGTYPLIVFSHASVHHRRGATFLCTHISSHGYIVAAVDHSEVVAPELARRADATDEQKKARTQAILVNRVPDVRFVLDHLLGAARDPDARIDRARIGVTGHSMGGWTALAALESDPRIASAVALAPGGASRVKPGIAPATLTFKWVRDVPTLYLVAEDDVSLPLAGMYELFDRTPSRRQMIILRRADHAHFMDDAEQIHETIRTVTFSPELAWLQEEMKPIAELCSEEQSHLFARGLAVCHFDATLKGDDDAQRFLDGDIEGALAARGVETIVHRVQPAS